MVQKEELTAGELLNIHSEKAGVSWLKLLKGKDYEFVMDVVAVLKKRPDISLLSASRALIVKFSINRNTETVCRTLRELIRNAK